MAIGHSIDDISLRRREITQLPPGEKVIDSLVYDVFCRVVKWYSECVIFMTTKRCDRLAERAENCFPVFTHHPIGSRSIDRDHHPAITEDAIDLLEEVFPGLTIRDMMKTSDTNDDIDTFAGLLLDITHHIMLDSMLVRMIFFCSCQ